MDELIKISIAFSGGEADEHLIDFYDVSQALIGFQRSIALTTHLVLNDKIITQAPSLRGARILALPSEESSWKMTAVIAIAAYNLGTVPQNTVLGHIIFSLYDYVIAESLGTHVDFNKSIGQLYEEAHKQKIDIPIVKEAHADSLIEKCGTAIKEMHRPIYMSETATTAKIITQLGTQTKPISTKLTFDTYEFLQETIEARETEVITGRVSSYNANTYKGRIFVAKLGRPIPFELDENARSKTIIRLITSSLRANALKQFDHHASLVTCVVLRNSSKSGQLKGFKMLAVESFKIS